MTCVELDGEAVLYASPQGTVHKLDPLGTALWNCLDGTVTLRQLVDDLCDVFDGDSDRIAADVLAYARRLAQEGLIDGIEPVAPDSPGGARAPSQAHQETRREASEN